jgi:hypothetical protein
MPGGGTTTTASIPSKVRWLIATVLTVFGGTALAVGLGVIPLLPEKLHAPLWIVSACGVSFGIIAVAVNLMIAVPLVRTIMASLRRSRILGR